MIRLKRLRKEVYYVIAFVSLSVIVIISIMSENAKKPDNAGALVKEAASSAGIGSSSDSSVTKDQTSSQPGSSAAAVATLDKTIIIDPGHGGPDPGATGVGGVREKDLNLTIGEKLKDSLTQSGYSIIMTRNDDRSIYDPGCVTLAEMKDSDLNNRIKIDTENPHAVFISIHQNFNPDPKYSGTQVYYSMNNPGSLALAKLVQSEVKKELEPNNSRAVQPPGNLRVLMKSYTPAILIECGFISNAAEAANLKSSSYQDKLVAAINAATVKFFSQKAGT